MAKEPRRLTMQLAAEAAGVSKTSIFNWIKSGKLSATQKEDGTYRIDRSELQRVMDSRAKPQAPSRPVKPAPYFDDDNEDDYVSNIFAEPTEPRNKALNLAPYKHDTLQEVKHNAEIYIAREKQKLLEREIEALRQNVAKAEARADAGWAKYDEAVQRLTYLLEDQRPKRRKFLGIF